MTNPIAIIGLGPAGVSAAIQLHRYGLRPRIYEPSNAPGLLKNANLVENYPGFPDGITGPALYKHFRDQLEPYGPDIVKERVERIVKDGEEFIVDAVGEPGRFKYVILATGTVPRKLEIPHPEDRVFYEVADVPETIGSLLVAGGGDAAFDYALNLKRRGKDVSVLCRSEEPKCLGLLEKRCREADIEIKLGTALLAVNERDNVLVLELEYGGRVETEALLCAFGREPALDMLDADLRKSIDNNELIAGLFPCGDAVNGPMRQTGIAVGDGLRAAMKIKELIG